MNGDLETIYMELLQMKEELQSKLFEYASFRSPAEHVTMDQVQNDHASLSHQRRTARCVSRYCKN